MANENLERITILLQARDKDFARAMDRNNKLIARLNRDGSRNMRQMTTTVEGQLTRMSSAAATFGRNFARGLAMGAVAAGIGLVTNSVRGAVTSLARLGYTARDTGLDVEELQGLMRGLSRETLVSEEAIAASFVRFNRRVGEAVHGAGELSTVVRRYGLDLRRADGSLKSNAELLRDVTRLMRDVTNEQERASIGMQAFGDDGRRMAQALAQGPEALDAMVAQAREAGDVIDRNLIQRAEILDTKWQDLTRSVRTFFQTLAVGTLAGGAETPVDTLTRMFGDLDRARSVLGDGLFEALIGEAGELADEVERAVGNISFLADTMDRTIVRFAADMSDITMQLSDLGMTAEMFAFDDIIAGMEQLVSDLRAGRIGAEEFDTALDGAIESAAGALEGLRAIDGVDVSGAVDAINTLKGALSATRAEALALRSELPGDPYGMTDGAPLSVVTMPQDLLTGRRASPPERPPNNIDFGMPSATGGRGGGGGNTDQFAAAVESIQARTRALELEAVAIAAAAASGRDYGEAMDFARIKADLLARAMERGREITPELEAQIDALAEAYVRAGTAAEEAADRLQEMQDRSERGAEAIADIFMALGEGSDAAKRAIAQLLVELARVQMMKAMIGLGDIGGPLGSIFSALGGALGGGRASGGPVRAGVPYRVNENTPNSEIMVPSRSGGVLNVAQAKDALRGGGGAQSLNVTVTMDSSTGRLGAFVRDQAGRVISSATPQIVTQSVQATHESFREFKPG